jgi:outer membrane lipopolysaccharide assembly protein LptE/RlpB
MSPMMRTEDTGRAKRLAGAVLAAAVLAAGGCGYRLRGTGSSLPPQVRTMCIPMFKNLTTRFERDVKLTRAVINELVARGKVAVTGDAAASDAILEGEITSFSATPIGFSGGNQADKYNIIVTAKVTLKDRASAKILFANPGFVYQQEYDVPPGANFESMETEAIDKIASKFARSLVVSLLEGF